MPGHVLARYPTQRPTGRRPRPRVRTRILYGQIVLERIEIRTRDLLDQFQLIGVRQAAISEPEILVKSPRINDKRPVFPLPDGASVEQRVVVVAADLALMAAAIG